MLHLPSTDMHTCYCACTGYQKSSNSLGLFAQDVEDLFVFIRGALQKKVCEDHARGQGVDCHVQALCSRLSLHVPHTDLPLQYVRCLPMYTRRSANDKTYVRLTTLVFSRLLQYVSIQRMPTTDNGTTLNFQSVLAVSKGQGKEADGKFHKVQRGTARLWGGVERISTMMVSIIHRNIVLEMSPGLSPLAWQQPETCCPSATLKTSDSQCLATNRTATDSEDWGTTLGGQYVSSISG